MLVDVNWTVVVPPYRPRPIVLPQLLPFCPPVFCKRACRLLTNRVRRAHTHAPGTTMATMSERLRVYPAHSRQDVSSVSTPPDFLRTSNNPHTFAASRLLRMLYQTQPRYLVSPNHSALAHHHNTQKGVYVQSNMPLSCVKFVSPGIFSWAVLP